MEDVEDLCQRLIVINHGVIGYDGPIGKIIEEYSQDKNIKLKFDQKVSRKDLQKIAKVLNHSDYEAEVSVPQAEARLKINQLMTKLPVKDVSIMDVTLEEVIGDKFAKRDELR